MLGRRRSTHTTHRETADLPRGAGLARGPALLLGTLLAAAGLILFLEAGDTPTGAFPDGTVQGTELIGIETNGWTAWFTTAAGVLLLFGAAQHLLAKLMSGLVGLALAACAVIALVDGDDVLGLAAANGWTALGWAIPAVLLLLNVFAPRRRGRRTDEAIVEDREHRVVPARHEDREVVAPGDRHATTTPAIENERPARTGRFHRELEDEQTEAERTGAERTGAVDPDRARR